MMNYKWKQCVLSSFFPIIISKHCISYSLFPNIFHVFSLPWSLNISLQNRFSFHLLKKKKKKKNQAKRTATAKPLEIWQPLVTFPFYSFIHPHTHSQGLLALIIFFLILQFSRFILNLCLKTMPSWQQFWCENHFLGFLTFEVICSITTSIILIFSVLYWPKRLFSLISFCTAHIYVYPE